MKRSWNHTGIWSGGPTVASLYSGCGGFDKGFEHTGFDPVGASDLDPRVVKTFNTNLKPVARVIDLGRNNPDHQSPSVLIAGSPCQGFSTAGKQSASDPRNQLLVRAGEIALRLMPRVFILENVPAALNGKLSAHWKLVEDMLRWNGYNVRRLIAEGTESGLGQARKRAFLVAWQGSDCIRIEPARRGALTLSQALEHVEEVTDHDPIVLNPLSKDGKIARRLGEGQKLSNVRAGVSSIHTWDIPEVFGSVTKSEKEVLNAVLKLRRRERKRSWGDGDPVQTHRISKEVGFPSAKHTSALIEKKYLRRIDGGVELVHTYNGKYRRLAWSAAAPTVDTHFGDPALFLHPEEDRGFTPREAARIQGFSDAFQFLGSRAARFKMIGNAVPPPMAARLARFVRAALL